MKRTDGLIQCKCKEWRKPEEMCMDFSCIYCEDTEVEEEPELTLEDLEIDFKDDMGWDLESIADGYVDPDDDEDGHDW